MEIRNCRKCRRLYNYVGSATKYCPACQAETENKFHEVKEFITKHPGVGIKEVSAAMDVDTAQIRQWIREERLVLSNACEGEITCEKCGVCITTGRYCESCKVLMTNTLRSAYHKGTAVPEQKKINRDGNRMRFLDKQ